MPKKDDIQHSVLIISASEQFDAIAKKSLRPGTFVTVEFRKSASLARRSILERYYDMVVINAPLPDENGIGIALDIAEKTTASVLMVVPKEIFEDVLEKVTDYGILVLPKPFPRGRIDHSIRFIAAAQNRLRGIELKLRSQEEKIEELRRVSRAKLLLVEKKGMSEDEAHRHIGKIAMDSGISRGRAADMVIDDLE